jgi:hypothetical protein
VFFWAGVPLAAVAGAAAVAALPGPRAERAAPAPGIPERLAFAVALTALTIALVQGEQWSWGWSALLLLAGAVMLRRVPWEEAGAAALAWATLAGCVATLLFLLPEYFQLARNLSGLRSGALLLAVTVPASSAWALSLWLAPRVSAPALAAAGTACAGVALAALAPIDADTRYALLIVLLALAGTGLGAAGGAVGRAPALSARSAPLAPAFAGAALGLAGAGFAFQSAQADERAEGASFEAALAAGVGWAALLLVALLAGAVLLGWRLRHAAPPAA